MTEEELMVTKIIEQSVKLINECSARAHDMGLDVELELRGGKLHSYMRRRNDGHSEGMGDGSGDAPCDGGYSAFLDSEED